MLGGPAAIGQTGSGIATEDAARKRFQAERLGPKGRFGVGRAARWRALDRRITAGRVGVSRQRRGELALLGRLLDLDRQVVGIERLLELGLDGARRARVRRGPVELRERDVLLVDGQVGSSMSARIS